MNSLSAINAYQNQLKMQNGIADVGSQEEGSKPSFSDMMKGGLQDFVDTQNKAESMKMEAITGKVDITDLVTALSNAELSLNTVIAVRDKVIGAYQDIIRMPM